MALLQQQHESFSLLANAFSGIVGGASGTAVGQPFDTVLLIPLTLQY